MSGPGEQSTVTAWHVTVEKPDKSLCDMVVEASERATADALRHQLSKELELSAETTSDIAVDGQTVTKDNTPIGKINMRHGSCVSLADSPSLCPGRELASGWYIVTIAGPGTGWFAPIEQGVTTPFENEDGVPPSEQYRFQIKLNEKGDISLKGEKGNIYLEEADPDVISEIATSSHHALQAKDNSRLADAFLEFMKRFTRSVIQSGASGKSTIDRADGANGSEGEDGEEEAVDSWGWSLIKLGVNYPIRPETASKPETAYMRAGSEIFAMLRVDSADIASLESGDGATRMFDRKFRERRPSQASGKPRHPDSPGKQSWLSRISSLLLPLATLGMFFMMRRRVGNVETGAGVGSQSFLDKYGMFLVMALMISSSVIGVASFWGNRRGAKADYKNELKRAKEKLHEHRKSERHWNRWEAPPAGLAALMSRLPHERLWEREPSDEDFCKVAVGLHSRPSEIEIDNKPAQTEFPLDQQRAIDLRHSLVSEGSLAIIASASSTEFRKKSVEDRGSAMKRARAIARALLLDIAASHSPHDVKLWLITDAEERDSCESEWNGLRWLPHNSIRGAVGWSRVFSTQRARVEAFSALRYISAGRLGRRNKMPLPVHVVVIDCINSIYRSVNDREALTSLLEDGASCGVVGITLDTHRIPQGVKARLIFGESSDELEFSTASKKERSVRGFEMAADTFASAARSMASLRPADAPGVYGGTGLIRLADLIGLADLIDTERDGVDCVIKKNWKKNREDRNSRQKEDSLSVTVGARDGKDIEGKYIKAEIDLVTDGPHGLVGGTTGSGKTEFLKTLFTSLAAAHHPDDLSIVVVDFKGEAGHKMSARLPHVVDHSTNHDVESLARSITLLEAELKRREKEFSRAGAKDLFDYDKKRAKRESLPPIPRLLIVVDEFSELRSSESGRVAIKELTSVARKGRSAGVHLLLATQNFEGQLGSQITANVELRICFRMQEESQSRAVLGSPEAARIPKEQVGRAFLKSQHGDFPREFQGALVTGSRLDKKNAPPPRMKVRRLPFTKLHKPPRPSDNAASASVKAEGTDMEAIVEAIESAATKSGWEKPAVPWPKELPAAEGLKFSDLDDKFDKPNDAGRQWPIGLRDIPEEQRQTAVGLEAYGPHTLFIGGPEAHVGEVLLGVVVSGALKRSPEELHFYVIDLLGASGLSVLQSLPHTGGVADCDESLASRIVRHVTMEMEKRIALLSEFGMAKVEELQAATNETLPDATTGNEPDVVLVVHGAEHLQDGTASHLLSPIKGLLSRSSGTGVRVLVGYAPQVSTAGASYLLQIGHRFVFKCPEPSLYTMWGAAKPLQAKSLHSNLSGLGRAVNTANGHLMQFALVPGTRETPAAQKVQDIGRSLTDEWQHSKGSPLRPTRIRSLPYPLPLSEISGRSERPGDIHQPVVMAVNAETGKPRWLDAQKHGPVFVVCGPPESGRSSALIASAALMSEHGWKVLGLAMHRDSPIVKSEGAFPGQLVDIKDLDSYAAEDAPVALFIDDADLWDAEVDGLKALLTGKGDRCVIFSVTMDFLSSYESQMSYHQRELLKMLPNNKSKRCALVLNPQKSNDAAYFSVGGLRDEVLTDQNPGRGVLVESSKCKVVWVPFELRPR